MHVMPSVRPSARLLAASMLAFTAACSSDAGLVAGPDSPSRLRPGAGPALDITPSPASVVISSDLTTSFKAFTANNSGRGLTEFWDNNSADGVTNGTQACNVGFFASGTMANNCTSVTGNTLLNQGGYTQYLSGGAGSEDAAPFTFSGEQSYTVRLEGSIALATSEIGYYYRNDQGQLVFEPINSFGAKQIGSQLTITPAMTDGNPWGFYIQSPVNPASGGCTDTKDCSDATGGYTTAPFQQFALFLNSTGTKYLVGVEDNRLNLLPNPQSEDSDYNDYLISVAPQARGGAGCSPGFWKNARDFNWELAGYSRTTQFSAVFDNAFPGKTLEQVLEQGGGGLNALGRQTVAALLNASAIGSGYEYTKSDVINKFNAAYPGTAGAYETLKNDFERYIDVDGRPCPLNNGKGATL